jgi:hypothetical protein
VFVFGVFLKFRRKGERRNAGERNLLLPLPLRVQGKKKTHSAIQNDTVWGFFFNSG